MYYKDIITTEIKSQHKPDHFELPNFPQEEYEKLRNSIKRHGILQNLLVAKDTDGYLLLAGNNRYRIALELGMQTVPCVVVIPDSDMKAHDPNAPLEMAISTDVDRRHLTPKEQIRFRKIYDELKVKEKGLMTAPPEKTPVGENKSANVNLPRGKTTKSSPGKSKKSANENSKGESKDEGKDKSSNVDSPNTQSTIDNLNKDIEKLTKKKEDGDKRILQLETELNVLKDNINEIRFGHWKLDPMTTEEAQRMIDEKLTDAITRNDLIQEELNSITKEKEEIDDELKTKTDTLVKIKAEHNAILLSRKWALVAGHTFAAINQRLAGIQNQFEGEKNTHTKTAECIIEQIKKLKKVVIKKELYINRGRLLAYLEAVIKLANEAFRIASEIPEYPKRDVYDFEKSDEDLEKEIDLELNISDYREESIEDQNNAGAITVHVGG